MTHNCVSSTARAAKDLGYGITIAADACTTRDLPSPTGTIPARALHDAELAGLADHHGAVVDVELPGHRPVGISIDGHRRAAAVEVDPAIEAVIDGGV